jgi:hypothetical protein
MDDSSVAQAHGRFYADLLERTAIVRHRPSVSR